MRKYLLSTALLSCSRSRLFAATGQANTEAIIMFLVFIAGTMVITWWAARKRKPPQTSIPQVVAFQVSKMV